MQAKNSLFYDEAFQRFPVPLLAIELYAMRTVSVETDEDILQALTEVLAKACKVLEPVSEDYSYLVARLQEVSKSDDDGEPRKATSKSFGTAFVNYLNTLDTVSMLGSMTHYDIDKMRKLYCETDFVHVRKLMLSHTEGLLESNKVAFEACLYGFGNSYQNDGGQGNAIDADSKEGMAMLRAYGIGDVSSDMVDQLGLDNLGIVLK